MKRYRIFGVVVIFFLIATLFIGTTMAAEYNVERGDNLTKISKLTGHTIGQLVQMNNLENPNLIIIGQKITFISQKDIEDCRSWCVKRLEELFPVPDPNCVFFLNAYEDMNNNNIRYSINDPHGLHFSLVLVFAKAWRAIYLA